MPTESDPSNQPTFEPVNNSSSNSIYVDGFTFIGNGNCENSEGYTYSCDTIDDSIEGVAACAEACKEAYSSDESFVGIVFVQDPSKWCDCLMDESGIGGITNATPYWSELGSENLCYSYNNHSRPTMSTPPTSSALWWESSNIISDDSLINGDIDDITGLSNCTDYWMGIEDGCLPMNMGKPCITCPDSSEQEIAKNDCQVTDFIVTSQMFSADDIMCEQSKANEMVCCPKLVQDDPCLLCPNGISGNEEVNLFNGDLDTTCKDFIDDLKDYPAGSMDCKLTVEAMVDNPCCPGKVLSAPTPDLSTANPVPTDTEISISADEPIDVSGDVDVDVPTKEPTAIDDNDGFPDDDITINSAASLGGSVFIVSTILMQLVYVNVQ